MDAYDSINTMRGISFRINNAMEWLIAARTDLDNALCGEGPNDMTQCSEHLSNALSEIEKAHIASCEHEREYADLCEPIYQWAHRLAEADHARALPKLAADIAAADDEDDEETLHPDHPRCPTCRQYPAEIIGGRVYQCSGCDAYDEHQRV